LVEYPRIDWLIENRREEIIYDFPGETIKECLANHVEDKENRPLPPYAGTSGPDENIASFGHSATIL
jgi:hypothetical protein